LPIACCLLPVAFLLPPVPILKSDPSDPSDPCSIPPPTQLTHLSHPSHLSHSSNLLPPKWSALFPSDFCPPHLLTFSTSHLLDFSLNLPHPPYSTYPPYTPHLPIYSSTHPLFILSNSFLLRVSVFQWLIFPILPIPPIPPFTFHQNSSKHSTNMVQSMYKHIANRVQTTSLFIGIRRNFTLFSYPSYLIVIIVTQK